jgi:toxin secretion/phage lysis holin
MNKAQINSVVAIIGTFFNNLFGGWDNMMQTLVIVCIIDYITGVFAAIYEGRLSSKIGYKGIIKKICMFTIVALAVSLDKATSNELIHTAAIAFYISNEGISILENVGKTGVCIPEKIKNILKELRGK